MSGAFGRRVLPVYAAPRRGFCASCEIELTSRPVYRMDETYCCVGCAAGDPCVCTYELDLAEDAVDGLGLPFAAAGDPASTPGLSESAAASGSSRRP